MQILVVNDDGIASEGLWILGAALRDAGLGTVTIVAPETEQSGTSMALPFARDLTLREVTAPGPQFAGMAAYAFSGTPVGCVLAGVLAGVAPRPDLVVAGINRGLNTGTNVLLSGTVGAAMLAALWGLPALAVSQMFIGEDPMPWDCAAEAAVKVVPLLEATRGNGPIVLNLNVPHLPSLSETRGFRQTVLSNFFYGDVVEVDLAAQADDEGRRKLGLRFVRERMPVFAANSDDGAVRDGYVSLTPLTPTGVANLDLGAAVAALR
ncbi:MAG: 5'/3'-nucleotidase SurE [Oscillochloridaceae bacterium umkhey_bin13]